METQQNSRYSMINQKYWCHNCSKQLSMMRNSEDIDSKEIYCTNCNSVCEIIRENNNPRNFRIFDSNSQNASNSNNSSQNPNLSNNQNSNENIHQTHQNIEFFFPVQQIIFIPNNASNSNQPIFIQILNCPLQQDLHRRMHLMRLFEEFLTMNQGNSGVPPAEKDVINKLKEVVIEQNDLEKYKSNPCAVCQEDFKCKDIAKELKCKHMFHKDCIEPWLNMHRTCPYCRKEVI